MSVRVLFPGAAEGPVLALAAPLSFWGGIDPASGRVIARGHPQEGASVAGSILVVPAPIGSSSSSSVLLELIREGLAPAGIVLGAADAILVVGCLVAREMGWPAPPIVVAEIASVPMGAARLAIEAREEGEGRIGGVG
ncbi:aconitase X swivel domain-containing protein [Salinarimonas sp.]|uniref:aconitase X swivel domain-containing protein n=1 Tax=Salinarimonas sp. TaxID=2766526 RepID=UPI00391A3792